MRHRLFQFILFFSLFAISVAPQAQTAKVFTADDFEIELPGFFVENVPAIGAITVLAPAKFGDKPTTLRAIINGKPTELDFIDGTAEFPLKFDREEPFSIKVGGYVYVRDIVPIPLWMSILPPLLVILLALFFKEVISSLFLGIALGACIIQHYSFEASFWSRPCGQ